MLSGERMKLLQTLSSAFLHLVPEKLAAAMRRRQAGLNPCLAAILRRSAPLMLLLSLLLIPGRGSAQQTQPSEYQVKAAFLFNFAKFVEWPAAAFADAKAPLCIGVLGDNPFGADLERSIRDKTINDRPLTMRECRTVEEGKKCHILFISASEKKRLPEIIKALEGANVLTVGETDGFTEAGGMVNFVPEGNKFRFQINDVSAKSAGLKVSSKLLSLAAPRRASAGMSPHHRAWRLVNAFAVESARGARPGGAFSPARTIAADRFPAGRGLSQRLTFTAAHAAFAVAESQLRPSDADKNPA